MTRIFRFIAAVPRMLKAALTNSAVGSSGTPSPATIMSTPAGSTKTGAPQARTLSIQQWLLTPNKYSRPGIPRKKVLGIEIHWVGNPKTSAKFNRDYFELRKGGKYGYGSAHYIIDLDGAIYQMIPDAEIAYSSGAYSYKPGIVDIYGSPPYYNTLSIECTHIDWEGTMTSETYRSLVDLTGYLCQIYSVPLAGVLLHYDITGKECHKWFVQNPAEWHKFKALVGETIV